MKADDLLNWLSKWRQHGNEIVLHCDIETRMEIIHHISFRLLDWHPPLKMGSVDCLFFRFRMVECTMMETSAIIVYRGRHYYTTSTIPPSAQ